jgi:hypothetical protein
MKVAIVGSRGFDDYEMLKREVSKNIDISKITEIISGGAKGADTLAEKFANEKGILMTVIKPNWSHGKGAGIIRNKTIVESADTVFAFWDGDSKGTKNSIGLGDRLGKQMYVIKVKQKERLTLKQLSVYLAYELRIKVRQDIQTGRDRWETITKEHVLSGYFLTWNLKSITPVLRPLSDLDKEIEINGKKFIPFVKIGIYPNVEYLIEQIMTGMVEVIVFDMLLKWHFDVYGLIEKGLAEKY